MEWIKVLALSCLAFFSTVAAEKPNVVFIYADDVGYGDVGVYGSKKIPTPHLDTLARSGIQFTDGHASAATCSPSRFSMLTGVHAFRHGVRILPPNAPLSIPTNIMTLPKMFKKAGYETAVIGKWHLGIGAKGKVVDWNADVKPGPLEVGFDYSFLLPSTNDRVPCVYVENHRVVNLDPNDRITVNARKKPVDANATEYPDGKKDPAAMTYYRSTHGHNNSVINGIGRIGYMSGGQSALWDDETMADEFVNQAKKYLAERKKGQPFFLYFSSQDIHVPRAPHPRFQGKTDLGFRGDAMVQLDWSVGAVVDALKKNGLYENTIIIFSSDNGPVYDDGYDDGTTVLTSSKESDGGHDGSGPYRGGKYQIYEGGTRVPFIVSWPAKIKAKQKSAALINQIDFIASFASYLKVDLGEEARDSRNLWKVLTGASEEGHEFMLEEAYGLAIRMGDWKYIPRGRQLYNLKDDVGEQKNVAKKHPEIVKLLEDKIKAVKKKSASVKEVF